MHCFFGFPDFAITETRLSNFKVPSKGSVLPHKASAEVSTKAWLVESNGLSQTTPLTGRQVVGTSMFDYIIMADMGSAQLFFLPSCLSSTLTVD
jgi:hypothetical protein